MQVLLPDSLNIGAAWLLQQIRAIGFGRIEALHVRSGQPLPDPPARMIREFKLGGSDHQTDRSDYLNKRQVRELLALFEQIGDGVIDCIEVRHGLPFRVVLTNQHLAKEP